MVFAIHLHESAIDLHVFPMPIPTPASFPIPFLWVFPVHWPRALVSCIQPGLAICFTLDNIHVISPSLTLLHHHENILHFLLGLQVCNLLFLSWKMKPEGFHNSRSTSLCPCFSFFSYCVHNMLPQVECYRLIMVSPPPNLHVQVLAPRISECDIERRVIADEIG